MKTNDALRKNIAANSLINKNFIGETVNESSQTTNDSDLFTSNKETFDTIKNLPNVDLHRHLEGSFTPEQIIEVAQKYNIKLPANTVEELRPYVQVMQQDKTLLDFLKKFDTLALLFKSKDVIKELTYKVIEDANKDNIRYLELRFAPHYMQSNSSLSTEEITDAVLDGIKEAKKDFPIIRVEPILIAVRHLSPDKAQEIVELALKKNVPSYDLASDEYNFPPELFCHVFKEVKEKNLNLTIHAGEARGAESVKKALECGADRIGHGVRSIEDPTLIEYLKDNQIPLEVCPTSNVQTGAVKDFEHHPVKQLFDNGLNVTINTDDPGVSGITLSSEYRLIKEKYGFSVDDLKTLIMNGAKSAFLPPKDKELLINRIKYEFNQEDMSKTPLENRRLESIPGCDKIAYLSVTPKDVSTPQKRLFTAEQMLKQLKQWPTISAVISSFPNSDGNTTVIVASSQNETNKSKSSGIYDVIRRLSGSSSIKEYAKKYPTQYSTIQSFDSQGKVTSVRLPGICSPNLIFTALKEGAQPNQLSLVKRVVENLPKGKRIALLIGGPSGAGKTTLIDEIKKFAGDRKVTTLLGDMYFRDMNDPNYPKTSINSPYWDSPNAMHFDEMCENIADLVSTGKTKIPVYDFTKKVDGVTNPNWKDTGKRVGYKALELGNDDILLIDSLHSTNSKIINKLSSLNLPHASIYIDTPKTDDRLLRKIARDYNSRSAPPEQTIQYWNVTNVPGETEFIQPTILNLDPAQDVTYLTQGPNDLGLTQDEIENKVKLFAKYGLAPTYQAFSIPPEQIETYAKQEAKSLNDILSSAASSNEEKQKAKLELEKMKSAPLAHKIFTSGKQHAA